MRTTTATRYLGRDEVCPSVDLASCFRMSHDGWARYRLPGHHLILVETGGIVARMPRGGRFEAHPRDLICFRPTDNNAYATRGDTVFYQTHVLFAPPPRHALTPWLDGIGPLPIKTPLGDAFDDARRAFETIILELPHRGAAHAMRIKSAIFELLAIVAGASRRQPNAARRLDPWQRVQVRMGIELDRELSIKELAREIGVTAEHFIRRFKEQFGASPRAYHTQLRLREAARLLRNADRSVKSVAYALGFPDPRAFARLLKRHAGLRPSDLRLSTVGLRDDAGDRQASGGLIAMNRHVGPPGPVEAERRDARLRPRIEIDASQDGAIAWYQKWGVSPDGSARTSAARRRHRRAAS